jgi:subtilisin-like proprotein convertase family protein
MKAWQRMGAAAGLGLACVGCGGGGLDLSGVIFLSNNTAVTLLDDAQPPANYPSTIDVSTPKTMVQSISIVVNLTHNFPDDVDILLVGPTGQKSWILSDCFGDTDLSGQALFLQIGNPAAPDSTVALPLATTLHAPTNFDNGGDDDTFYAGPAPVAPPGPYAADLSVFIGTNPNGTWRLYAKDDLGNAVGGVLNGWILSIGAQ